MADETPCSRVPVLTVVGLALMFGTVAAVGLWPASPADPRVISYGLFGFGLLGLVFMIGVVVGGLWFGRRSSRGKGPRHGPPGRPDPGVVPLDDLDRELEELLGGREDTQPTTRRSVRRPDKTLDDNQA
jgi:hypothetical protein